MVGKVDMNLPQDMRDLLIRLDQRVDDGFKNMNDKLDAISRRTDNIDNRVRVLEDWKTEVQGGAKGIGLGYKVLVAFVSLLVGALGMAGLQAAIEPKKDDTIKSEVHTERTLTIPKAH